MFNANANYELDLLLAELKKEEVTVEETAVEETVVEFTHYSVWGEVDKSEKTVSIMGKEVECEVVEGLGVIVKPITIKNILEDWGMVKSVSFYQTLAKKVQKMIREMN